MSRLNQRAFEILRSEVLRCGGSDATHQTLQELACKKLERLRSQSGSPLSLEEMREEIASLFPNFSEKALRAAARANRSNSTFWGTAKLATLVLAGTVGAIWLVNLPIPIIRWSVAKTFPVLLLPSFASMDYNYRRAIALVEQADQLVNQSTSPADLALGDTKAREAQKHLDALPVWFLGYYPQRYCTWFQCGWQYTLDEFQGARKKIGRMEAQLFQEKNAQTTLEQGEQSLNKAQQEYQQAETDAAKQKTITDWQSAIDTLQQIPPETLAGRLARTKLVAYERDFQQASGFTAGNARTGTLIAAAKQFAKNAQAVKKSAYSAAEWEEIINLWGEAIARLNRINETDPDYLEAQTLLATYQRDQGTARTRQQAEQDSVNELEQAQSLTNRLIASTPSDGTRVDRNYTVGQLQEIIDALNKVQKGTTAYPEAQQLLKFAQNKLKQLR